MTEAKTEPKDLSTDVAEKEVAAAARKRASEIGYENPHYQKTKTGYLGIVGPTAFLEAIDRYAGSISLGIFGIAVSNIFKKENNLPLLKDSTTLWLAGTALATAVLGIFAHYKKAVIAQPKIVEHREGYSEVTARLTGDAVGRAVSESITPHLKALQRNNHDSQDKWRQRTEDSRQSKVQHAI